LQKHTTTGVKIKISNLSFNMFVYQISNVSTVIQ
jgi:hypothetical protein